MKIPALPRRSMNPSLHAAVAATLLASTGSAHAQGAALEEVIVYAQKRAESLQDVPVTVQAYTAEQLTNFNIARASDISKLAPNLNVVVQNAMSQHVVIRGVGTNEFFGNSPSSVGLYMDEVTMNSSYLGIVGLYDIERVEILRGPQNSLFGRNTTGGAVNYISRQPNVGGDVEGFASALYGSHNRAEIEAGVNLPMGDTMAARLAGKVHRRDGIWNNIDSGDDEYGDSERYSGRATLAWSPGDATRVTFSGHYGRDNSQAQPQHVVGALDNNPPLRINDLHPYSSDVSFTTDYGTVSAEAFNRNSTDWHDVYTGGSQKADLEVYGGYVKIVHDFGGAALTSITAYDKTTAQYEEDNTVSGNVLGGVDHDTLIINMDQNYEQVSQEFRLASSDDDARFRWIAGLYYFKEDSLLAQDIRFGSNGVLAFHPAANGIVPISLIDVIPNPYANTVSFSIADLQDEVWSAYGHTNFDLTDKLTLTVGLRYNKDDKSNPSYYAGAFDKTGRNPATFYDEALIRQLAAGLPPCPDISAGAIPFSHCANTNTSREDITDEQIGGKVGLDFRFNEQLMVFAGYSRGFKSGKFDVEFLHTDSTPFPQRPLKEETLDAFEIGFKSDLLDRRMQLNGAVFYNIWKDQQVFNVGPRGPEFFNLPESEIRGLELELRWVPAESWLISAGLGLLDSEITDATGIDYDLGQGEFQVGHELPLAPETTANAAIIKDIDLGENQLELQLDGRYQSKSKVKFSPQTPIDEYESRFEMNARATYSFGGDGQYKIGLAVDNLTSEEYCVEKQDLRGLTGVYYCVPNEGETQYALRAEVNF